MVENRAEFVDLVGLPLLEKLEERLPQIGAMHGDLLCARLFVSAPISLGNFLYLVRVTAIRCRVVLRLRIRIERQVNGVLLV